MSDGTLCGLIEAVTIGNDRNALTELLDYFARSSRRTLSASDAGPHP